LREARYYDNQKSEHMIVSIV